MATYVRRQVGCARAAPPSVPLDRERDALWARLLRAPRGAAGGCPPDGHDAGRCPEPREAAWLAAEATDGRRWVGPGPAEAVALGRGPRTRPGAARRR